MREYSPLREKHSMQLPSPCSWQVQGSILGALRAVHQAACFCRAGPSANR